MRIILGILFLAVVFSACKKDKFTTVPQIKFKSISPDRAPFNLPSTSSPESIPKLTLSVTDLEGDIGFKAGKDTSRIYVKNLISNQVDSFFLPDINSSGVKNFQGDLIVTLQSSLDCRNQSLPRPRTTDTTYYEVYIVDFAKNKSNIIRTEKPLYLSCF